MRKKWGIILSVINAACLLAVATISITVWALSNGKAGATAKLTINNPNKLPGTIMAGISVNGENSWTFLGADTPQELSSVTEVSVSDVNVSVDSNGDGYVNVWFAIENTNPQMSYMVIPALKSGESYESLNEWEDTENIKAQIYTAEMDYDRLLLKIDLLNSAEQGAMFGQADDSEIAEGESYTAGGYLTRFGISAAGTGEIITIPEGTAQSIVVRYNISDIQEYSTELYIGIDLFFYS